MKRFMTAAAVFCVIAGAFAGPSAAEEKKSGANAVGTGGWSAEVSGGADGGITLDANQTALVDRVSKYFNELKSLQGSFVQTAADNSVMKGEFAMQQPGKFRFDYSRPSRQIIISDGNYLAIQDLDLSNEDRVALDQTPFRILLRKDVNLLRDAKIVELQQADGTVLLALRDKSPDAPGKIKLVLSDGEQMELKGWTTTDAQGLDTKVEIAQLKRDVAIDADKFVIKSVSQPFAQ